jgi:hypothetical protein
MNLVVIHVGLRAKFFRRVLHGAYGGMHKFKIDAA